MRVHELKCWPSPFQAILDGNKRHEIRKNDRGFQFGDVLHLREWVPHRQTIDHARLDTSGASGLTTTASRFSVKEPHYTGRELRARVTFLSEGGTWGLPADLCVMSIEVQP